MKTNVNKLAISTHVTLKLGIETLISYLKLTCEYDHELITLSNAKDDDERDHGENYMKVRASLVRCL